jgi:hypothetical protein
MGREIITADGAHNDKCLQSGWPVEQNNKPDDYWSRLIKYIPTEIIGLYVVLDKIISSQEPPNELYAWIIFIVCAIITPFYLWKVARVNKIIQIIISFISFIVWVHTLGGPFKYLPYYNNIIAAIILPIFIVIVSIYKPIRE